jgi:hypothetical protein
MSKYSVRTSQETHYISATKPDRLILFRETISVFTRKTQGHSVGRVSESWARLCTQYPRTAVWNLNTDNDMTPGMSNCLNNWKVTMPFFVWNGPQHIRQEQEITGVFPFDSCIRQQCTGTRSWNRSRLEYCPKLRKNFSASVGLWLQTILCPSYSFGSQRGTHLSTGGLSPISSPLRLTTRNFFQLNTCGYSPYVTSSLTRGWVSRLWLLLVLASAVIFRSQSRGTHNHILLTQTRDSPNL